jgi:hypothetical protein
LEGKIFTIEQDKLMLSRKLTKSEADLRQAQKQIEDSKPKAAIQRVEKLPIP